MEKKNSRQDTKAGTGVLWVIDSGGILNMREQVRGVCLITPSPLPLSGNLAPNKRQIMDASPPFTSPGQAFKTV